jgi:hypothetical protein
MNPEGTCVATAYRGPYSNRGTVCAGARLAATGQCVQFSVSNDKASRSPMPDVGSVTVLGEESCRGL